MSVASLKYLIQYITFHVFVSIRAATYINAILRLDCGYHCPEVLHIGTAMTKFRQKATATIQEDFHVQMDVLEMPNTPESVIWKAKSDFVFIQLVQY